MWLVLPLVFQPNMKYLHVKITVSIAIYSLQYVFYNGLNKDSFFLSWYVFVCMSVRLQPLSLHIVFSPFRSTFLRMWQEKTERRGNIKSHFHFLRIGLETINSDIRTHLLLKLLQFFVVFPCSIKTRTRSTAVIIVISSFDTKTRLTSHFSLY